jgi:hypothetical protein
MFLKAIHFETVRWQTLSRKNVLVQLCRHGDLTG